MEYSVKKVKYRIIFSFLLYIYMYTCVQTLKGDFHSLDTMLLN